MEYRTYYCDICGEEVPSNLKVTVTAETGATASKQSLGIADICPTCYPYVAFYKTLPLLSLIQRSSQTIQEWACEIIRVTQDFAKAQIQIDFKLKDPNLKHRFIAVFSKLQAEDPRYIQCTLKGQRDGTYKFVRSLARTDG